MEKAWDPHGEVLYLPAHCAACSRPGHFSNLSFSEICSHVFFLGEMKMLLTTIPFFRDVLLMAFNCQFCGHKSNEVKVKVWDSFRILLTYFSGHWCDP
jgi:hypothetical protein